MVTGELALARYEEMRQAALERPGTGAVGQGAVILIRQGMAAWMRAWSECSLSAEKLGHRQSEPAVLPRALAPDVVVVLAEMVLQASMEAR